VLKEKFREGINPQEKEDGGGEDPKKKKRGTD